jgi:uncharacterized protein
MSRIELGGDWSGIGEALDAHGCARVAGVLAPEACTAVAELYGNDALFRSRIVMARHGFGSGEYKYFADPLPEWLRAMRAAAYARLVPVADLWRTALGGETLPAEHAEFLARCRAAGQARPTPLLLRYGAGDWNALHQDIYGDVVFPLQVAILLSRPGEDFAGGEFVLTEQRPRMQSRAEVVALGQGDAVVFATRERPVRGARGTYRVALRHGVSRIRSGTRMTLGVILHDAA